MKKKKILLIITGSIASYKALTLIRLIKNSNIDLSCILTKSAEKFVTPLSVSALTGEKVYSSLFNLDDEMEMGHIKLAKEKRLRKWKKVKKNWGLALDKTRLSAASRQWQKYVKIKQKEALKNI